MKIVILRSCMFKKWLIAGIIITILIAWPAFFGGFNLLLFCLPDILTHKNIEIPEGCHLVFNALEAFGSGKMTLFYVLVALQDIVIGFFISTIFILIFKVINLFRKKYENRH